MIRLAVLVLLALALPAAAQTQQGFYVMKKWTAMDTCAKQAQTAFPDFTAQSNAQREAQLKRCLEASNLPPFAPLTPPQR